nr:MAG TPA: hypothetical protein [Caudoviricetes sp.]
MFVPYIYFKIDFQIKKRATSISDRHASLNTNFTKLHHASARLQIAICSQIATQCTLRKNLTP